MAFSTRSEAILAWISMVSPGRIFFRNRTLLIPKNRGIFPAYRSADSSRISAVWAMHSTEYTPGSTGSPGKWPLKISRAGSTKNVVTMWSPASISSTVSTSSMGSRWGMMALISSLESFMIVVPLFRAKRSVYKPRRDSGTALPLFIVLPTGQNARDNLRSGSQKRAALPGGSLIFQMGCLTSQPWRP